MVEHLIADEAAGSGVREHRFEVRHVEVAHAPGADLPGPAQAVERLERLVETQVVLGPVQEEQSREPVSRRSSVRSQARMVPRRLAFSDITLETRKTSSRRP